VESAPLCWGCLAMNDDETWTHDAHLQVAAHVEHRVGKHEATMTG